MENIHPTKKFLMMAKEMALKNMTNLTVKNIKDKSIQLIFRMWKKFLRDFDIEREEDSIDASKLKKKEDQERSRTERTIRNPGHRLREEDDRLFGCDKTDEKNPVTRKEYMNTSENESKGEKNIQSVSDVSYADESDEDSMYPILGDMDRLKSMVKIFFGLIATALFAIDSYAYYIREDYDTISTLYAIFESLIALVLAMNVLYLMCLWSFTGKRRSKNKLLGMSNASGRRFLKRNRSKKKSAKLFPMRNLKSTYGIELHNSITLYHPRYSLLAAKKPELHSPNLLNYRKSLFQVQEAVPEEKSLLSGLKHRGIHVPFQTSANVGMSYRPIARTTPWDFQLPHDKELASVSSRNVWTNLSITQQKLVLWSERFRMWMAETILKGIVKEIDVINKKLISLGYPDFQVGVLNIFSLKQLATLKVDAFPTLGSIVPYLEVSLNQEYLVNRLKDLSVGSCMKDYEYDGGGPFASGCWTKDLPADSTVICWLFCYLTVLIHEENILHM